MLFLFIGVVGLPDVSIYLPPAIIILITLYQTEVSANIYQSKLELLTQFIVSNERQIVL